MSDARAHVDLEQAAIESETAIEIGETRVCFALESSTPKILFWLIAHNLTNWIAPRIVTQLSAAANYNSKSAGCFLISAFLRVVSATSASVR